MTELLPGRSYIAVQNDPLEVEIVLPDVLPIDRTAVDATDLGVKELRSLIAAVTARAYGSRRSFVINSAEQLSEVLQNTLLKLIEEPPAHLTIILQAKTADGLLPTLRSRLHRLQATTSKPALTEEWNEDRFVSELKTSKDRAAASRALEQARSQIMTGELSVPVTRRLELIDRALVRLRSNCNFKLTLDALLLRWHSSSGME